MGVFLKQWQKEISKLNGKGEKKTPRIKYKLLQDAKEREDLDLPDLKLFLLFCSDGGMERS